MLCRKLVPLLVLLLAATAAVAQAQDFSIDAVSPEVPIGGSEADIYISGLGPPFVWIQETTLGLLAGSEEMDAFSYGIDQIVPAGSANWVNFFYSVDRLSSGFGGAVTIEASGNGAAGDQFRVTVDGNGVVIRPPILWSDATGHGLTPLPGESDLDAHSGPVGQMAPVYFSVSPTALPTASVRWGMPGLSAADILYVAAPGAGVTPTVYASEAALSLAPGDDIDAVAISDRGPTMGVLDPGDVVYISLTPSSPSLTALAMSPASVIQIYPAPAVEIFPPAALDLIVTDNLNAMTGYDPGPGVPMFSPWGFILLPFLLAAAAAFLITRRRVCVRT
ncbi:MAG: hypothetical protein JSW03_06505 [Candidatus Eiseniibacteriota bacterium]|nr:MAG: hypothetical protein JSW03_06505 [Candidatus Eisenbacteria bacterium]